MKTFNERANYPFTYGDKNADEVMLSDYVAELMKTKRFQNYVTAIFFAFLTLGSYAQPSLAIPPEYGEAANEILNQAGEAAGGGAPVPGIGEIKGQVPIPQANPQCYIPAMPIEQQRLIAAQQAGRAIPGMPIGEILPTSPPAFYIPGKPKTTLPRAANTIMFTSALGIVCLNATWGEPVAILMCSSGLIGLAYKLGKEVVVFMARSIK